MAGPFIVRYPRIIPSHRRMLPRDANHLLWNVPPHRLQRPVSTTFLSASREILKRRGLLQCLSFALAVRPDIAINRCGFARFLLTSNLLSHQTTALQSSRPPHYHPQVRSSIPQSQGKAFIVIRASGPALVPRIRPSQPSPGLS
jgi:hypothetical protein